MNKKHLGIINIIVGLVLLVFLLLFLDNVLEGAISGWQNPR